MFATNTLKHPHYMYHSGLCTPFSSTPPSALPFPPSQGCEQDYIVARKSWQILLELLRRIWGHHKPMQLLLSDSATLCSDGMCNGLCTSRRACASSLRKGIPREETAKVLSMVRRAAHHKHQVRGPKQLVACTLTLDGLEALELVKPKKKPKQRNQTQVHRSKG